MATIKTASLNVQISVSETLDSAPATAGSVLNNQFDAGQRSLSPTTTPAVSKYAGWQPALVAGTLDIDLTSLPGTQGSFSGLTKEVVAFRLKNPASNSGTITIQPGTSNGYDILGSVGKAVIPPGGELYCYKAAGGQTVDATHKVVNLAGTGTEACDLELILG